MPNGRPTSPRSSGRPTDTRERCNVGPVVPRSPRRWRNRSSESGSRPVTPQGFEAGPDDSAGSRAFGPRDGDATERLRFEPTRDSARIARALSLPNHPRGDSPSGDGRRCPGMPCRPADAEPFFGLPSPAAERRRRRAEDRPSRKRRSADAAHASARPYRRTGRSPGRIGNRCRGSCTASYGSTWIGRFARERGAVRLRPQDDQFAGAGPYVLVRGGTAADRLRRRDPVPDRRLHDRHRARRVGGVIPGELSPSAAERAGGAEEVVGAGFEVDDVAVVGNAVGGR